MANHCYEHLRISRDITKLMKILQFHTRIKKIMKTIEFTKSIMKIMKISEFQLKNNENHENPIVSHQKYENHCNPENSQIMTIMKILEFH